MLKPSKAGTDFEELGKFLFELLSKNDKYSSVEGPKVFLDGADGKREFDIVLRAKIAGMNFLTVIECRDWAKKLDVTHIDGFESKIKDVNANKGVIISRKGFTPQAISKAKRYGIALCIAKDISKNSTFFDVGLQAHILVAEILKIDVKLLEGVWTPEKQTSVSPILTHLNDIHVSKLFGRDISTGKIDPEAYMKAQQWRPFSMVERVFTRGVDGTRINYVSPPLFEVTIIETIYHFGCLSDLPNSKSLENLEESTVNIFFHGADIFDHQGREKFAKFKKIEDIPSENKIILKAWTSPRLDGFNLNIAEKT